VVSCTVVYTKSELGAVATSPFLLPTKFQVCRQNQNRVAVATGQRDATESETAASFLRFVGRIKLCCRRSIGLNLRPVATAIRFWFLCYHTIQFPGCGSLRANFSCKPRGASEKTWHKLTVDERHWATHQHRRIRSYRSAGARLS